LITLLLSNKGTQPAVSSLEPLSSVRREHDVEGLFEFLALQPAVANAPHPQPVLPVREAIQFRGVSFCYPGTDRLALDGLYLTVPAGAPVRAR
jgi:ABC-type multidrug transport system fused ATPase/permease subunit